MYFSVCCWLQTLTCNLFTLSSPKFLLGGMLKRLYAFCWFCSSFFSTKRLGAVLLTSFSLWFLGRLKCNRSTGHSESISFIISPKDFHSRTLFRAHPWNKFGWTGNTSFLLTNFGKTVSLICMILSPHSETHYSTTQFFFYRVCKKSNICRLDNSIRTGFFILFTLLIDVFVLFPLLIFWI